MKEYNVKTILKNEDDWIKHLKGVVSKDGDIYDAVTFDFEFGFESLPSDTHWL